MWKRLDGSAAEVTEPSLEGHSVCQGVFTTHRRALLPSRL